MAVLIGLGAFLGMGFYFAPLTGGRSLDFIFTEAGLRAAIEGFSDADIARHVYGTRVLDMGFPLLYGAAIALVLMRYHQANKLTKLLLLLGIGVAADFMENIYNLDLLAGGEMFTIHLVFTWVKFACLSLPLYFALQPFLKEASAKMRRQNL